MITSSDPSEIHGEHPVFTWNRSVPVERSPGGGDAGTLRALKEYDQHLRIRWDPKLKKIVLFRWANPSRPPHLICHWDGPLDGRLLRYLVVCDFQSLGGARRWLDGRRKDKKAKDAKKSKAVLGKMDWNELYYTTQRWRDNVDFKRRHIFSGVPASYEVKAS